MVNYLFPDLWTRKALMISLASASLLATPVLAKQISNKQLDQELQRTQVEIQTLKVELNQLKKHRYQTTDKTLANAYAQGISFVTSGSLDLRTRYNVSDLVVNMSTMNEDLRLLQQRKALESHLLCAGKSAANQPLVTVSGSLEGAGAYAKAKDAHTKTDLDLSRAELDILAQASPWATGMMSLTYDNRSQAGGYRVAGSRFFLKRGFLTIGNLNISPFYMSVGQMYAPFGAYSNHMISNPLTMSLARTNSRLLLLGYNPSAWYAQVYGFRGDSHVDDNGVNQWGANLGYKLELADLAIHMGAGYIANLADSSGMQLPSPASSDSFQGFGASGLIGNERLMHRVAAADVHAKLAYQTYSLVVEYISALRAFDAANLRFNGVGAKPQALHTELAFNLGNEARPLTLGLGYGRSWQTLALNMPKQTVFAVASTSWWKNTLESLELRHDRNFAKDETSGGNGVIGNVTNPGSKHSSSVIAQIGLYF